VICLENNGELIVETKSMLDHALSFYKALFGKEDRINIRPQCHFWEESEKVSWEENLILEVDLSE
jgi:hypothetical protein